MLSVFRLLKLKVINETNMFDVFVNPKIHRFSVKTSVLAFLLFFTFSLGLSSLAKAFETDCSEKEISFCNWKNVQSPKAPVSEHGEDGQQHDHCLAHCGHFVGLLNFNCTEICTITPSNTPSSFYVFFFSSPDLDGPFRPPQV